MNRRPLGGGFFVTPSQTLYLSVMKNRVSLLLQLCRFKEPDLTFA